MKELIKPSGPCGYSVLINTPGWLTEQAQSIRYEFIEKPAGTHIQGLSTQLPLVNLMAMENEEMEQKVVNSVERIASMIHCFEVAYTGFSFFDAEDTFRVNVKEEGYLLSLSDLLQGELRSCNLLSHTNGVAFSAPDFTGELPVFSGAYHEFTCSGTANEFRVSSLSILKKVANSDSWQLLKEVPFGRA